MKRHIWKVLLVVAVLAMTVSTVFAQATTKQLSTNFTLVNLEQDEALVHVDFIKDDGTPWSVGVAQDFTIAGNGGQAILRQYFDTDMAAGRGSAVVSANRNLGSVVQIQARTGTPSQGAYTGVSQGSETYYIPLLQKNNSTASGVARSEIVIQNADTEALDVYVALTTMGETTPVYTAKLAGVKPSTSYYYDLTTEANLPATGWVGSAEITAKKADNSAGLVIAISNLYIGANGMMTFNGFAGDNVSDTWYLPQVTSRLLNGQSASVSVQNLSGAEIAAEDLALNCTKDPGSSSTVATLAITNATAISDKGMYTFNPVVDTTNFPTDWYGSCVVSAPTGVDVVALVQVRYTNGVGDAAAYEGINGSSTDTKAYVPLILHRIPNGGATVTTIQNLDPVNEATVTITYVPSEEYAGSQDPIVVTDVTIPAGGSIIRNQRLLSGPNADTSIPAGWLGTMVIEATTDTPIQAYVAITNLQPTGDMLMAHLAFTVPATTPQ